MQADRYLTRLGRNWVRVILFVSFSAGMLASLPTPATAEEFRTASLTLETGALGENSMPAPLSVTDAGRYRQIFEAQEHGRWAEADRQIAALDDKVLMAEVLAQRYRSRKFREASYAELEHWLQLYADEPEAKIIYALAVSRHRVGVPLPTKPQAVQALAPAAEDGIDAAQPTTEDKSGRLRRRVLASVWDAGLSAWRQGRLSEAGEHFEALADSKGLSSWTQSAAAFWAARVALRTRHPEGVSKWLRLAAEHPRTFYGLLARRLLGVDVYFNFDSELFTDVDQHLVGANAGGRRALALLQVGERARAEEELRALAGRSSPAVVQSIAALADRANMPSLSLQLAAALASGDGRNHVQALYPVPRWAPLGGFIIDRALVFALMRQESQFLPKVESSAGAVGLLQMMPSTARSVAQQTGLTPLGEKTALVDPELNMTLAQEYIAMLLHDEHIHGNLLMFACAWNGGPSAAAHWRAAQVDSSKDPLLFLESIPSTQARVFTHRVLANYWIYRIRLGQSTQDLDALAAGEWPTYTALDNALEPVGLHAANR